jgi:hypothetical protein
MWNMCRWDNKLSWQWNISYYDKILKSVYAVAYVLLFMVVPRVSLPVCLFFLWRFYLYSCNNYGFFNLCIILVVRWCHSNRYLLFSCLSLCFFFVVWGFLFCLKFIIIIIIIVVVVIRVYTCIHLDCAVVWLLLTEWTCAVYSWIMRGGGVGGCTGEVRWDNIM